jgi:hypothetical protein
MSSLAAAPPPGATSALDLLAAGIGQLLREDPLDLPSVALGREIGDLFTLRNQVDAEISRRLAGNLQSLWDDPLRLACESAHVNTVGEPYSGKPNVRFDEGRLGRTSRLLHRRSWWTAAEIR